MVHDVGADRFQVDISGEQAEKRAFGDVSLPRGDRPVGTRRTTAPKQHEPPPESKSSPQTGSAQTPEMQIDVPPPAPAPGQPTDYAVAEPAGAAPVPAEQSPTSDFTFGATEVSE